MNSLYFKLLLCQFMVWITEESDGYPRNGRPDPSEEVELHLVIRARQELIINLRKTETFLANENLEVWAIRGDEPDRLHPIKNVMQSIGHYTTYQDRESSSAAVYFHNRHQFDGTIDSNFYIRGLPIELANNRIRVYALGNIGVFPRTTRYHHRRSISEKNLGGIYLNKTESVTRTQRELPNVYYVKILLIVGADVVEALRLPTSDAVSVTSYLLTLMNSVEMLYSKIVEPKIRINIAGIILGTEPSSFSIFPSCYKSRTDEGPIQIYLEISCIESKIQSYIRKNLQNIPQDSYDIVTYITSNVLRYDRLDREVVGVTTQLIFGPYESRKSLKSKLPCIILRDENNFATFATFAHEIAHALRYHEHDDRIFLNQNGYCCTSIMAPESSTCKNCLVWSSETEKHLKDYFSSPNRCFYINEPLSLKNLKPRKVWTEDEQCHCFGYARAGIAKRTLLNKICHQLCGGMCAMNLNCFEDNGASNEAPLPMDGTPCGVNKNNRENVCWNRKCVPIESQ